MLSLFKKSPLQKRQLPPRESFILIRARTDTSLLNYLVVVISLVYIVILCASLLCGLVVLIFNGTASTVWNAFLQIWPHVLLGFAGMPENRNDLRVTLVCLWVLLWFFFLFLLWFAIKLTRDLYGLCRTSWMQRSGNAPIAVRKHFRISHAPWLSQSITDAPSPTALLDLLQQENDWSHVLAEILEQAPQEKRPPVTVFISVSEHLTVSIIGQDGKQEPVEFDNPSWKAILAFFAFKRKGEWVPRKTAQSQIYGAEGGKLFDLHTSRLNEKVNKMATDAGFLDELECEEEPGKLDLFEHEKKHHLWRLSPRCEVEIFSDLTALHEQVLAAQAGQMTLSRTVLRTRCYQVMQRYGQGLLAPYQKPHQIWPWLREAYITYREQFICILEYAALCEWQASQEHIHSDLAECQDAIWHSARFSGFSALVALGIVSRLDAGEPGLIRSLERYYLLKEIDAAGNMYQMYAERMNERDSRWTPSLKIQEIWPEVTQLHGRKTER